MKKIVILTLLVLISFSSSALAGNTTNGKAGAALELKGLTIGVSPGIFAHYADDGTTGNVQWFGIATAHQGGTTIYGAAQNNSGTFKIDVGTATITGPLTAGTKTYQLPTSTQAASTTYWSDADWTR